MTHVKTPRLTGSWSPIGAAVASCSPVADAAPLFSVGPGELAAALGLTRSSFMRALARGWVALPHGIVPPGQVPPRRVLPAPAGRTRGRWRQWTAAQLPELCAMLRALGREVPEGWE